MNDTIIENQSGGLRGKFAFLALAVSVFSVGWFAIAALGSKYGLWGWQFGLGTMTIKFGPPVAFGALGLSTLAIIIGLVKSPRKRPVMTALGALLISALMAGRMAGLGAGAQSVPPIHDIQTDWDNPVVLTDALMRARGGSSNPVRFGDEARFGPTQRPEWQQYVGKLISDIQQEAECQTDGRDACKEGPPKPYKPIKPLYIEADPAKVFEQALVLAKQRGWEIVSADPLNGRLEATHTSRWWGFKDDIAIRLRGNIDGSTRVDMRSISRVGGSDLGANARRVTAFLYDLEGQRWEQGTR